MRRAIEVSTRGMRLLAREKRLEVKLDETVYASIPPEDLDLVILGSSGVSISSGALQVLADSGVAVLSLDQEFKPSGLFLPMWVNSLHSERFRLQTQVSAPMGKKLWAALIERKIRNQALMLNDNRERAVLEKMADAVKSGDTTNVEAKAARYYWPRVFSREIGEGFSRHKDGKPPNNLLNYGYSVLRASAARALCVAGLQPALGLHHHNRYSGFCLADDLMEPFRPCVDRVVRELVAQNARREIDKEVKSKIIGVLVQDLSCGEEHFVLEHMLEHSASSLAICMERQVKDKMGVKKAVQALLLPDGWPGCH